MELRKVKQIEKEFGQPFDEIVIDLAYNEDYLGCTWGIKQLAGLFETSTSQIMRWLKRYGIKIARPGHIPTKLEDYCWVKHGVCLETYLKKNSSWMSDNEMASDLNTTRSVILHYLRRYHIKHSYSGWRLHGLHGVYKNVEAMK